MRSMVEGARLSMLAAFAPLHRTSCGPPPRAGEEPERRRRHSTPFVVGKASPSRASAWRKARPKALKQASVL